MHEDPMDWFSIILEGAACLAVLVAIALGVAYVIELVASLVRVFTGVHV